EAADRTGEPLERHAHVAPDDREVPPLAFGLHLQEYRLVEASEPGRHVRIEARVDDVHGLNATGRTETRSIRLARMSAPSGSVRRERIVRLLQEGRRSITGSELSSSDQKR